MPFCTSFNPAYRNSLVRITYLDSINPKVVHGFLAGERSAEDDSVVLDDIVSPVNHDLLVFEFCSTIQLPKEQVVVLLLQAVEVREI